MTYFDDVSVGDPITERSWGPFTEMHLMRWSATIENWHRIHYDAPFAKEHDKLPAPLVNGSLKQHLIVQGLRDWAGGGGWLWRLNFKFHGMDVVRDEIRFSGTVTDCRRLDDFGVCDVDVAIANQRGEKTTSGLARVALPFRGGSALPYPFYLKLDE